MKIYLIGFFIAFVLIVLYVVIVRKEKLDLINLLTSITVAVFSWATVVIAVISFFQIIYKKKKNQSSRNDSSQFLELCE